VAWDGTRTLAVWTTSAGDALEVRGALLEKDGRVGAANALFAVEGKLPGPTGVAWSGSGYFVAGAGLREPRGPAQLRGARVTPQGTAVDGGVTLAPPGGPWEGGPTVAWLGSSGGGFAVLWATESAEAERRAPHLTGSSVSPEGVIGPLPAAWSSSGAMPFVVSGSAPLAVWSEVGWWTDTGTPEDLDVRAQRLGRDGTSTGPSVLLSTGTNAETEPVVAWSGERLLVVWEDRRDDRRNGDIFAARLAADGTPLDASAIPVAVGAARQHAPTVAWDGHSFVVAWQEGKRGLGFARVAATGDVLAPVNVPGTAEQPLLSDPALCGDGDGALLVWGRRAPGAPREAEIRALRIPRGGSVTDNASFLLAQTSAYMAAPAVRLGCNGRAATILWSGDLEMDRRALNLGRLERGRTALNVPASVLMASGADEGAGIGTDGEQFLVTWRQFDAGRRMVVGTRIDADGQLLDQPARRIGQSNSGQRVTAAWTGSDYVVLAVNTAGGNPFDLRGRRVTRAGDGLDADWWVVATLGKSWGGTGNGSDGVYVGNGRAFIVYDRFFDEDATGNVRVVGRFVSATPEGAGEADGGVDAGVDAGDAGVDAAGGGGGCGCRVGGAGGSWITALFVVALWFGCWTRRPARERRAGGANLG
jgi:hypothetical protein